MGSLVLFSRVPVLALVVLWVGFLVCLAFLPSFPDVPAIPEAYIGPLGHFATHGILTGMAYIALRQGKFAASSSFLVFLTVFVADLLLGLLLEGGQLMVETRSTAWIDVLYNVSGSLAFGFAILSVRILGLKRN